MSTISAQETMLKKQEKPTDRINRYHYRWKWWNYGE